MQRVLVCLLAFTCITFGIAVGSPSSTSAPSTAAVIEDSPKAALKAYNAAMRAGDIAGMVAMQQANNEDERRVARACAQSDLEVGKLLKAANDKFGSDGRKKVAEAVNDEGDDDIDAAEETVNGNTGGVTFAGANSPSPLIRVDGSWKVDVAAMLKQFSGNADQLADSVIRRGSVAKVTAQEVVSGQYTNADAVVEAIKGRMKDE